MHVGVYLPQAGFAWDELRARAVACDRAGIASLWLMDHLYPPAMPGVPSFEAWTTATALAAATERIRIGHLVLANGFRHPALLAKMAITLDHTSGGRLDLGLGSGSWAQEFREHGLPFGSEATRASELDEALTIVKRLFTEERVDFAGRHYRLANAPSLPRPVQRPHPPIHVGGAGPKRTLPLVARHADVWNCPTYALGALPERVLRVRDECRRIGRDPASLRVTEEAVLAVVARRDRVDAARADALRRFPGPGWGFETHGYCGTPDDVLRRLEGRRALGVDGVVFFLHDRADPDTIELVAREIVPTAARMGDGG
jgi:alkanesulfonate monooxygenase SsuD/methylene tetrahydromethanopterin reductase-like flavin-dependent oxidoreductase (luciferase family)